MKPKLFVQLGRSGDILNILPLVKREYDLNREEYDRLKMKPALLVARDYERLLEGVSYVNRFSFDGRFEDVIGGMKFAEEIASWNPGSQIICTQIYGEKLYSTEKCWSFLRESWDRVPNAPAWGTLPLVFDNRDPERERGVKDQLLQGKDPAKPYVVAALSGTSSPFPHAVELLRQLRHRAAGALEVVDISGFACDRFFDLLGLLEGASSIITVDSGVLHLAHAVPNVPVVAFITREPTGWHGSAWRRQQVVRIPYDIAEGMLQQAALAALCARKLGKTTIWHVWSHYEKGPIDDETIRRNGFAQRTWQAEQDLAGCWREAEFKSTDSRRDSGDAPIFDPRPMPYWKDLVEHAARQGFNDHDVVALTNGDSCFTPGITGEIFDAIARHGCAYTHRWDFYHKFTKPLASESAVQRGKWYPGSDAFFFTVGWWNQHRDEYPDMLVGREQNDEILRQLIKRHGGVEIPAAIYHEKHPSFWEHHGNRENNAGNKFNRALARKWFLRTGYGPNDPDWWKIPGR